MELKTIVVENNEIKVRPYLLSNEIDNIINEMIKYDNYLQRVASRDMMILHFCTDINVLDENNNIDATFETYDKYRINGTIEAVLNEINENDLLLIDEAIYYEEGINKTLKNFLELVDKKIDNYFENINSNDILTKINDVVKK